MARTKNNMALTKLDGQVAARKRFKITFGKALQNAPGRSPVSAAPQPKATAHPPGVNKVKLPSAPTLTTAQEDYLAKAAGNLESIKSQSGIDLTEKVKDLVHLPANKAILPTKTSITPSPTPASPQPVSINSTPHLSTCKSQFVIQS